jgi:hypothetical protein
MVRLTSKLCQKFNNWFSGLGRYFDNHKKSIFGKVLDLDSAASTAETWFGDGVECHFLDVQAGSLADELNAYSIPS